MNPQYVCSIPATDDFPKMDFGVKASSMESNEENALWHYNHSRAHDNLPPVSKLPAGTTFIQTNT